MRGKKNLFDYIMWFLYALFAIAVLMLTTEVQTQTLFGEIPFGGLIPSVVIVTLTGLAVFQQLRLGRHRRTAATEGTDSKKNAALRDSFAVSKVLWEIGAAVVLLAIGLVLRLDRMMTTQGELTTYYETAIVVEGWTIPSVVHGASYLYLEALHLLFLFVGNKFAAAVWFQIILQFLAVLTLFVGVRKLAGPGAALVMLGFFIFANSMINGAVLLSPQMLYLLIFAIGIDFLLVCWKGELKLAAFLGAGVWIGWAGYLDIGGFLLLILLIPCAAGDRSVKTDKSKKLIAFILGVLGTLIGFFGAIGADTFISGKSFGGVLKAWMGLYVPKDFKLSAVMSYGDTGWWAVLLAVCLTAGVFKFQNRMSMWVLSAFAALAAGCFGIFTDELPVSLYLFLFPVVLAGLGVGEISDKPAKVKALEELAENDGETEVEEEVNQKLEEKIEEAPVVKELDRELTIEVSGAESSMFEKPKVKKSEPEAVGRSESTPSTSEPEKTEFEKNETEKPEFEKNETEKPEGEKNETEKPEVKKSKPTEYIENPLPLPKPHVKKTMGYDRNISAEGDDFDYPVDDNDDFDI